MTAGVSREACPRCSGPGIRQGTKLRRIVELSVGGEIRPSSAKVQRWRCETCGSFFSSGFDAARPRSLVSAAARDVIAADCFRAGFSPAASAAGVDEKTARSLWDQWAALREADLPDRPPVFMGLHEVHLAGASRTLVTDVQARTVVDVLAGVAPSDLGDWLGRRLYPERIDTVAIAFQPSFRTGVCQHIPGARLLVCPAHAEEAGAAAFLTAFRRVKARYGAAAHSNVREAPHIFSKRYADLSAGEAEDLEGWSEELLRLHEAKEVFLDAFSAAGPGEAFERLAEASGLCRRVAQAVTPVDMIDNWGREFASGIGEGGLTAFSSELAGLSDAWARRRPTLPFPLARGLAVLTDLPRVHSGADSGMPLRLGISLGEVTRSLVLQTGDAALPVEPGGSA